MSCKFRVFAPKDTLEYYTEEKHEPKYLTPISLDGMPRVFKVRSEMQNSDMTFPAIALFKHHETYELSEPSIDSFLVKGYGIIPAENLVCDGEMHYPTSDATQKTQDPDVSDNSVRNEENTQDEDKMEAEIEDNQVGGSSTSNGSKRRSKGPLITQKDKIIKS